MADFALNTARLVLRPFQESDAPTFSAYRSDKDVALYQGWDAPYPLAKAEEFIADMQPLKPGTAGEWYQIALESRETGEHIGDLALHVLDEGDQAEIGFTLAPQHHGHGYASEAVERLLAFIFDDLKLHRVSATCDAENVASTRVLERVGMRREGHFVEAAWFKERWSSEFLYAMLQREWSAKQK